MLDFSALETPFSTAVVMAPLVARLVNLSSAISKLNSVTYPNISDFNLQVFQLVNNSILNSSTFNMLTLYK